MRPVSISRRTLVTGAAATIAATAVGLPAFAAEPSPKPTVVLVHGGFADATASWSGVIAGLQSCGYPVLAPANPLRDLRGDAAYIASVVSSVDGPVILVGHSYGGAVITNAAAETGNVKALVYIAAFMPDVGEVLGALIEQFPGSEIGAALNPVPYPGGTDLYIRPDQLRRVFAADLPRSTTRIMASAQRPFGAACFSAPTTAAAWRTIPSWGLVATEDKAIPPALQHHTCQRAGTRTISSAASHCAMVSHPDLVVRLITDADRATR